MKGERKKKSLRRRKKKWMERLLVDVTEFLYLDRGRNCLIPGKSCQVLASFSLPLNFRHFARVKFTIFNFILFLYFLITYSTRICVLQNRLCLRHGVIEFTERTLLCRGLRTDGARISLIAFFSTGTECKSSVINWKVFKHFFSV